MYAQVGLTGIQELFINKNKATAGQSQIPFTASILSTSNPLPLAGTNGWTYLPSGMLLKFGGDSIVAGTNNVVFPVAGNIPVYTVCMFVYITPFNTIGGQIQTTLSGFATPTGVQFDVVLPVGGVNRIAYWAIGY
jgi:hypothetical protein